MLWILCIYGSRGIYIPISPPSRFFLFFLFFSFFFYFLFSVFVCLFFFSQSQFLCKDFPEKSHPEFLPVKRHSMSSMVNGTQFYFQTLEMVVFPCRTGICFSSLLKMENLCLPVCWVRSLSSWSLQDIFRAEPLNMGLQKSSKLNQFSISLKKGEEKVFKTKASGQSCCIIPEYFCF